MIGSSRRPCSKASTPTLGGEPEPTGRDHADEVAAGEREHVAVDVAHPGDEMIGTVAHGYRQFAVRAAVAVEFPTGPFVQDFFGQFSLESTVVPFHQVGINLGDRPEAGQFTRLRGTLQRAGKHPGEGKFPKALPDLAGALLPMFVQRQVGSARSLPRIGPSRVAVPGDE
jgi:hypothetical protein